jgi:peptidoglycan/LPS O-acetylase OafA/YrhL
MKTHRILGILWLALWSYGFVWQAWPLSHIPFVPNFSATPALFLVILVCLLYLAGAVASFFLFRGTRWARKSVGLIAVLTVILAVVQIVVFRSFSVLGGLITVFALVSAVLLFLPRHEPVA